MSRAHARLVVEAAVAKDLEEEIVNVSPGHKRDVDAI